MERRDHFASAAPHLNIPDGRALVFTYVLLLLSTDTHFTQFNSCCKCPPLICVIGAESSCSEEPPRRFTAPLLWEKFREAAVVVGRLCPAASLLFADI